MSETERAHSPANAPRKGTTPFIRWQRPMVGMLIALAPCAASAVYHFGWRAVAVFAAVVAPAFLVEWLFCRTRKEPVSSAVFVTSALLALVLPPTIPLWMASVGAVVAIGFAKEPFGGFGRNIFNPALTGRCFLYICFADAMCVHWTQAAHGGAGAVGRWLTDAVTGPTPLAHLRAVLADPNKAAQFGALPTHLDLLLGNRAGSLGETTALAILIGGLYLLIKGYSDYRLVVSMTLGVLLTAAALWLAKVPGMMDPLWNLMSASTPFVIMFMVTDPVSAPRRPQAKWIYGFLAGALSVLLRRFGVFTASITFVILLLNAFNPSLDLLFPKPTPRPKGAPAP